MSEMNDLSVFRNGMELGKQLLLLLGFFLLGLGCATFFASAIVQGFGDGTLSLYLQSIVQSIFAFILPAYLTVRIAHKDAAGFLGLNNAVSVKGVIAIALVFVTVLPALNQIIYWNENMQLPSSFSDLEQKWRELESQNAARVEALTAGTSVWNLIAGISIIGLLTGFAEEIFFRGGFQKELIFYGVNRHLAIWITAIIFSLMHFQMFGFFPRLLLGAWFGYIYVWSGNLWLSAIAHALNNSIVMLTLWLVHRNLLQDGFDRLGVTEAGFPLIALISAIVTAILLFFVHKVLISASKNKREALIR